MASIQKLYRLGFAAFVLAGASSAGLLAQTAPGPAEFKIMLAQPADAAQVVPFDATYAWIASEMSFEAGAVTGAPYSAEAVTETEQLLADGNRISRRTSAFVARDREGRTRREQTLGQIGPFVAQHDAPTLIVISDAVANVTYLLEPETKTARRRPLMRLNAAGGVRVGGAAGVFGDANRVEVQSGRQGEPQVIVNDRVEVQRRVMVNDRMRKLAEPSQESLGTQFMEGVEVEGSRTVMTIPAGDIGNERPIEIVSERWFSPKLKTVVMTRHSDPRMGQTVYRLTNLTEAEPSPDLFQVPPDYTITDDPGPTFERRVRE
jgi:hypothetical protein